MLTSLSRLQSIQWLLRRFSVNHLTEQLCHPEAKLVRVRVCMCGCPLSSPGVWIHHKYLQGLPLSPSFSPGAAGWLPGMGQRVRGMFTSLHCPTNHPAPPPITSPLPAPTPLDDPHLLCLYQPPDRQPGRWWRRRGGGDGGRGRCRRSRP